MQIDTVASEQIRTGIMLSRGVSEKGFVDYFKFIPWIRKVTFLVLKRKDTAHTGFHCFFLQDIF